MGQGPKDILLIGQKMHNRRRVQQFLYCYVSIRCRENVFIGPLPSNDDTLRYGLMGGVPHDIHTAFHYDWFGNSAVGHRPTSIQDGRPFVRDSNRANPKYKPINSGPFRVTRSFCRVTIWPWDYLHGVTNAIKTLYVYFHHLQG